MPFHELASTDLFDEEGRIPLKFCCRSSQAGGDCYMPFRLYSAGQPVPASERRAILAAVNKSWAIGGDGNLYCPACVTAISAASCSEE